jgi:hypothetical protein
MSARAIDWLSGNRDELHARLRAIKRRLSGQAIAPTEPPLEESGPSSALARLVAGFGLSPFERDVLLLCAGMELDPEFPSLCATAQTDVTQPYPTLGLALSALAEAHWSALSPEAPLRHWRLIEIGDGPVLTRARLRIDERILHFLLGLDHFDERLAMLVEPLAPVTPEDVAPSQAQLAEEVTSAWLDAERGRELTVVQLNGSAQDCRPIAARAADMLGLRAASLPGERLPGTAVELDSLLRLWERESVLSGFGVLLLDCDDALPRDSEAGRARDAAIARLLERSAGPLILREREPRRITKRPAKVVEAPHPPGLEQLALWRASLSEVRLEESALRAVAAQFSLSLPTIHAIAAELRAQRATPADPAARLWTLCRRRLRSPLDGLAQRVESRLRWCDLVLPGEQMETLQTIAAHVRWRGTVHEEWGFAQRSRRGLGLTALFHGPSGTGKTMAAEVLANELSLDLYHIDLSQLVSKYIGETEANLRRVFDAAEDNGAILLFDEADSLFGSRSEVKDSHDRYANIEVSYLLQRMEAYRGLAILTTNMRSALDAAFLRRIRFLVAFPFPEAPQRAAIWRSVFPSEVPTRGLDAERLSRLNITGGNIYNIALNAAFLAADAGEPLQMRHLETAARSEFVKLGRRPTLAESEAWV